MDEKPVRRTGRLLTVLLALCLVFLAAVGYLLRRSLADLRDLRAEQERAEAEIRRLAADLAAVRNEADRGQQDAAAQIALLLEERAALKTQADGLREDLGREKGERAAETASLTRDLAERERQIAALKTEKAGLEAQLARLTQASGQGAADLAEARRDLEKERGETARLRKDLDALRAGLRDRDARIAALLAERTLLKADFAKFRELYGPLPDPLEAETPAVDAQIAAVEERDGNMYVTINAGANQRLKDWMKLSVFAGEIHKGDVRIIEVLPASSVCVQTTTGAQPPAKGDQASTRRRE